MLIYLPPNRRINRMPRTRQAEFPSTFLPPNVGLAADAEMWSALHDQGSATASENDLAAYWTRMRTAGPR